MTEKPTYEELERRVAALEQQVEQYPPEILSVLMEAFRYIPLCKTFDDAAKHIFDHCKRLIGAHSGYVALLSEDGEENEVLYLDAGGLPCDVDPNLPMLIRGLREDAYETKKVVYDNAFQESPWLKYMPDGHVKLENVLFTPLNIEDKTVGVIGIANKPGGFDKKDVQTTKLLGDLAAVALTYAISQDSLRESEELSHKLFSTMPDLIVQTDLNGDIIFVNNYPFPNPKSIPKENFLGKNMLSFIAEKDQLRALENTKLMFDQSLGPREYQLLLVDGTVMDAEVNGDVIHDAENNPKGMVFVIRDITERKRMEETLKKSEERLKLALDSVSDAVWDWRVDTGEVYFSTRWYTMLGYEPYELPQEFETWRKLLHPEDLPGSVAEVFQHLEMAEPFAIDFRMRTKDNHWRWILARGRAVEQDEQGKAVRMLGTHMDITERKRAEEALESNYALLKIAGETANFGGWIVDLENNICTWSDAVADIHDVPHGYSPPVQEAINFYAPEWREKITHIFSACAKDGIPYDTELQIITQKGKRVWVRTTGKAVKNEKDKIIKVQGSFQDITERKRAEEALIQSEQTFRALFEKGPIGVAYHRMVYDDLENPVNCRFLAANKSYQKLTGVDPTGKLVTEAFPGIESDTFDWIGTFGRVAKTGEEIRFKQHLQPNDRWYDCVGYQNKPDHFVAAFLEITEQKRAEAEKEKIQEQLNQAQKMESVGRLAGGVAHDFNNMLGVILGHTELALLKTDEDNDLVSDLKEIQKAAKRSADTTKQLLAFARKQTISPKQIDLNDTVESMLNMLRRLIGEDIDLVWKPAVDIWPVKMDPSQIDQILANLCVNARDAISGVGKLTIETGKKTFDEEYCKQHSDFTPGDFVMLAVSDNGCGMDKATLDNLFEPFFTTKDVGKGTGLGLATIYGIVKQNNGFINVYSEPGQGSTFKIYLPRLVADEETDKTVPKKKAAAGGTETILLVEDEPTILRMTRMMLERKGYSVLSAPPWKRQKTIPAPLIC